MKFAKKILLLTITLLTLAACSDGRSDLNPGPYGNDDLWICKPGVVNNRCEDLDQDLTNIFSELSMSVSDFTPAADPSFDCFYVYPTVDNNQAPGNTEDLSDDSLILRPLYNQAARFLQHCNLYAPLYHQMTISAYGVEGGYRNTEYFARAFADVEAAFNQYLLESGDRPFVLYGHSQGSHMLLELLEKRFENNPVLRGRLISALLIGPTGNLKVPAGDVAGGTFNNIPLCTHATDTGCIVAFDSIAAGGLADRDTPDEPRPCVNPTLLGDNPGVMANTIWQDNLGLPVPAGVETQWFGYPELHTASCEADGFLAIDRVPDDTRSPLATPQVVQLTLGGTLHVADVSYSIGDLLRIVAVQAEHMP